MLEEHCRVFKRNIVRKFPDQIISGDRDDSIEDSKLANIRKVLRLAVLSVMEVYIEVKLNFVDVL